MGAECGNGFCTAILSESLMLLSGCHIMISDDISDTKPVVSEYHSLVELLSILTT